MSGLMYSLLTSVSVFLIQFSHIGCSSLCSGDSIQLTIDDSTLRGAVIYQLNGTGNATLVCPTLELNSNNTIILKISLRNPCFDGNSFSCQLECENSETRNIYASVTKTDLFPPTFELSKYKTAVAENAAVGTEIFRFGNSTNVTDQDCATPGYNYQLEQTGGPFTMGLGSLGNIVLQQALKHEQQPTYQLNVSVSNHGKTGYTMLEVDVVDFDDRNPAFESNVYHLNITEETTGGESLITEPPLECYDGDTGLNQTIFYSFMNGTNSSEYFEIDQATGKLLQIKSVDREQTPSLTLLIKCFQSDKPTTRTASATLAITVLDINDHLPVFNPTTYNISLIENAVGYITMVSAVDQDQGTNADFTFHLSTYENMFDIDGSSGIITVKDSTLLDREAEPMIQFQVFAVDNFGNYSENNATVHITLIDVNDNSPQFTEDQYNFFFNQTQFGYVVGQLNATDADETGSSNSDVRYTVLPFWSSMAVPGFPLALDEYTGEINITGAVSPSNQYNMIVQACDSPEDTDNRRCTPCRVLAVYTENTTTVFEGALSVEVMENAPIHTMIQILPVIGDEYAVSTDKFTVDKDSNVLQTLTTLDRENTSSYHFNVLVTSYTKGIIGNISIDLRVLDVNDNAPNFKQREYFFTLPESSTTYNHTVGFLESEDLDENENSNRTYSFRGISYPEFFSIGAATGNINLLSEIWKTTQTMFPLTAMVTDHGLPSLSSIVSVYISYMMIDSNSVRITAPLSKDNVENSKKFFEEGIASVLGYSSVLFETVTDSNSDVISVRTYIFCTAKFSNGTSVPVIELQRSIALQWSTIQDIFLQSISSFSSTPDDTLQTAEIALIAVSSVVFLGAFISIYIVCRQWNNHIKHHQLYSHMSRRSTIYDSQEMKMNFGDENFPSRPSTLRDSSHRRPTPDSLETSFGGNYVNPVFTDDDGNTVKVTSWSGSATPRVPRWSTSDSLKDAIASLEDLTCRLNSEDSISRVSNMSKSRLSQKSFKPDVDSETSVTPVVDYPVSEHLEDRTILVQSDMLDRLNSQQSDFGNQEKAMFVDGEILREIIEVNAPYGEENNNKINITEVSTAF